MRPGVLIIWFLAVAIEILFPLSVIFWFQRRYRVQWRAFLYGALVFIIFQMFTRIPVVGLVNRALWPKVAGVTSLQVAYFFGLALTAGLCESIGRWVGYRWFFRGRLAYSWANGVAYGLGHGGTESALLVGLGQLATIFQAVQLTAQTPQDIQKLYSPELAKQLLALREQFLSMSWEQPLLGAVERLLTLSFHVGMSLLVLQVFVRGKARWLWLAVLLHTLVDFSAPAMLHLGKVPAWGVELYLTFWAALGIWLAWRFRPQVGEELSS